MITTEDAKIAMHRGTKMTFEGSGDYTITGLIFRNGTGGYYAAAELLGTQGESIVVPLAWLNPTEGIEEEEATTEEEKRMMREWIGAAEHMVTEFIHTARKEQTKEAQDSLHELLKILLRIDEEYVRLLHQRIDEEGSGYEKE